ADFQIELIEAVQGRSSFLDVRGLYTDQRKRSFVADRARESFVDDGLLAGALVCDPHQCRECASVLLTNDKLGVMCAVGLHAQPHSFPFSAEVGHRAGGWLASLRLSDAR